jgi:hypothetical protein
MQTLASENPLRLRGKVGQPDPDIVRKNPGHAATQALDGKIAARFLLVEKSNAAFTIRGQLLE